MSNLNDTVAELVTLAHHLGEDWREYVIVGEGNVSARVDNETFVVKASGANMRTMDASGLVHLRWQPLLDLLNGTPTDANVAHALQEAKIDSSVSARPSMETFLHVVALIEGGARFVGHTHPIAANAILCSQNAESLMRHIYPDAITVCGPTPVFVPYHDPGVPLARAVRGALRKNIDANGEFPLVIYLQNHGIFALGQTAKQVENITAMVVKNADVMARTFALGGPRYLSEHDVARIHTRPDEDVRRKKFQGS